MSPVDKGTQPAIEHPTAAVIPTAVMTLLVVERLWLATLLSTIKKFRLKLLRF
jgi:hypothetical protein